MNVCKKEPNILIDFDVANLGDVESCESGNTLASLPDVEDPEAGYISDNVASNKNFYEKEIINFDIFPQPIRFCE